MPTRLAPGRSYFRAYDTRDGLPQGTIMALAYDAQGRLWAGTQDGAAWFDGQRWHGVDLPERGISNYVEAVLPTSDGSVWFGRQDGGIAVRKGGTWVRHTRASGLPLDRVNALAETRGPGGERLIWAGTYGGGLARWDGIRWKVTGTAEGLPNGRIWKLVPRSGPAGEELWVGSEQGGLARVDAEGRVVATYPGLPAVSVNGILEVPGPEGEPEIWASTFGAGLAHWSRGRWTTFGLREGLPSLFATDLAESQSLTGERVLWVATAAGLVRFEAGRFRVLTVRWGLPVDTVYRLKRDAGRKDALWIGTSGAGVLHHQEGGWRIHDAPSGLPGNTVLALGRGRDGTLLAGTAEGLARFEGNRWQGVPMPPDFQNARVNAVLEEPGGGALWLGTLGGLARFKEGRWERWGRAEGLPHPAVGVLLQDRDGAGRSRLWVGTQGGGLACFQNGRFDVHSTRTGLPSDLVLALARTEEGGRSVLWAGFRNGGLGRFQGGRWTFWDRTFGLPNDNVAALHVGRRKEGPPELWVGTWNGVVRAELGPGGPRWQAPEPELAGEVVHQIQEDAEGRLYFATNRGVVRLDRSNGRRVERFTEEDGLPSNQCSPSASLVDDRGRIWFGTMLGLAQLDPREAVPLGPPRPLRVIRLQTDGAEVPLEAGPLVVGPRVRSLVLEHALLVARKADAVLYRSQLMGYEAEPTAWASGHQREFTGLPPGAYRYRVWARDALGRETGPAELAFRLRPAWWQTNLARLGALVLGLGLVAGILRWRVAAAKARNRALKSLVSRRTRALEEANEALRAEVREREEAERVKDEFVSVVSHELRTPLTAIRGALGLLEGGVAGPLGPTGTDLVKLAHSNTLRLATLVNDLLDIQKLEAGQVPLNMESVSLKALVERSLAANRTLGEASGVGLAFEAEGEGWVQADVLRTEQVLANLLSNAVKFSPPGGRVTVHLGPSPRPERVRLSITNHGPAIPESFRSRIFSKFAQADASSSRPAGGTGLGLAISRALVERMGGRIDYESNEQTTTFWFELHPGKK
ncbi:MAG: Non-motile and phage-resistance protein [Acidobacteria bacterium ADurb.Bin340]|nr:MAG: Non-motile and phage-resistance protein [Acidobacteria bacterium ADurb.Bin340]